MTVAAGLLALAGIFTVAAPLPLVGGSNTTHAAPPRMGAWPGLDGPLKVMPVGDSITEGNGWQVPGAYRPHLWELTQKDGLPVDFVGSKNSGPDTLPDRDHSQLGGQIQDVDRDIEPDLRKYQPDAILLHIGTNNIWRDGELPTLAPQRLSRLIDHITAVAPKARLYVASIVPSVEHEVNVRQYNKTIAPMVKEKAARGANIRFVGIHAALTHDDLIDGIHPNPRGYAIMAEEWWSAITNDLMACRPHTLPCEF